MLRTEPVLSDHTTDTAFSLEYICKSDYPTDGPPSLPGRHQHDQSRAAQHSENDHAGGKQGEVAHLTSLLLFFYHMVNTML